MFNAERLLAGLLRQSLRSGLSPLRRGRRGRHRRRRRRDGALSSLLGGGLGPAAGLGALGIAIAAWEHFAAKGAGSSAGKAAPTPPAATPPPPPPAPGSPVGASPPPPPPPPAGEGPAASERQQRALLLVRAMVGAAAADGEIDSRERAAITEQLEGGGFSPDDRLALERELAAPVSVETLASAVDSPQLAEEVYTVSLVAIAVDSDAERRYLEDLASRLGLGAEQVARIHERLGMTD